MTGSELSLRIAKFTSELLGGYALIDQSSAAVPDGSRWFNLILNARMLTIVTGTSEIQRNILGERLLGLPKD